MKKPNRIRLTIIICTSVCICSYLLAYFLTSVLSKDNYEYDTQLVEHVETPEDDATKKDTATENMAKVEDAQPEESQEMMNILNAYEFVLLEEDGFVAVYYADKQTLYADTDISLGNLSGELQAEIKAGKSIYSEEELYSFLENHSS
ncbi:hypothetical protein LQZ18_13625 [Lachnospiraceae bacterium ZAX-1]